MPNQKNRAGKKALKRLKMANEDTLVNNDQLIRKISLSAPTTKITLNPSKSVRELTENFESNKEKEKTEMEIENGEDEDDSSGEEDDDPSEDENVFEDNDEKDDIRKLIKGMNKNLTKKLVKVDTNQTTMMENLLGLN